MPYNPTLTARDIANNFSAAICLEGQDDCVWRVGDSVVKFGAFRDLKEEQVNGQILTLLDCDVVDSRLINFSFDDQDTLKKHGHKCMQYPSWSYHQALLMPFLPNGTFYKNFDDGSDEQKTMLITGLKNLPVPYAVAGITDPHRSNIMVGNDCGHLITIDTRMGVFHTRGTDSTFFNYFGHGKLGVIEAYTNSIKRMRLEEWQDTEEMIAQCMQQTDIIHKNADALGSIRRSLPKDLLDRTQDLKSYLGKGKFDFS